LTVPAVYSLLVHPQSPRPEQTRPADELVTTRALVIAVLSATIVGAGLRFPYLASPELWVDESCTWYFACQASPFDFHTPHLLYENASRLYYMLLAGWTAVFGETPWGLRSFSAVLGTLTIPLVALWLRSVAGNAPAALGAALAAVHPLHVYYSREARFYPLWMIELIGLLWCAWLAVRTDRWRYWAGYAALALAALWTHYFTLFLAPAALILPLLAWPSHLRWRRWLLTNAVVAAVFAPWFVAVVVPVSGRGNADWVAAYFRGYPPAAAIPRTLGAMAPAGFYPPYMGYLYRVSQSMVPASVLGVASLIAAAVVFCTPGKRRPSLLPSPGRVFHVSCAIAPLALAWGYSVIRAPVYVVARYDQVAWPAVMLILSVGLVELGRRVRDGAVGIWITAVCALLAGSAISVLVPFGAGTSAGYRQALIRYLAANYRPGDRVVAFGMTRWDLCYYRAALWPDAPPFESFPASLEEQVGWISPRRQLADRAALQREAAARAQELREAMRPDSTIWILLGAYALSLGREDPAFQVDFALDQALDAAGAVDRPSDPNLPLFARRWPARGEAPQTCPAGSRVLEGSSTSAGAVDCPGRAPRTGRPIVSG